MSGLVFHVSTPSLHITLCHLVLLQGIAMQSILHAMVEQGGPPEIDFDFVLVVGHFLTRDENIFTFFEARLLPAFSAHCQKRASRPRLSF